MTLAKIALVYAAAAAAGIAIGLWTALMTYGSCGGMCNIFIEHRFAIWQSALIGGAVLMAVLAAGIALNTEFRRANMRALHWLSEDLSSSDSPR